MKQSYFKKYKQKIKIMIVSLADRRSFSERNFFGNLFSKKGDYK